MPRYFAPAIPGSLGNRQGPDAITNQLESETARKLALPRPDLMRIVLMGDDGNSFDNGLMVSSALVIGSNTVAHGLGRAPIGVVPYHSASESTPAHSFITKTGDQAVGAGAWTTITGWTSLYAWTASDPYADFNNVTGIYTVRRTSVISARATVLITSLSNGSAASARIRNITGGISAIQNSVLGADGNALLSIPFIFPCQAADQLAVEVIVGDAAVVAALAGASNELQTSFSASCSDKVEVYASDATNLYVHSDYNHTRSFWVF